MTALPRPALLLAGVAVLCAGLAARPSASGSAVARVNDAVISERDLDVRLAELLPMASFHGNLPAEQRRALARTALDELVFEELVSQEALREGRGPDAQAVDAEVARVRQRFPGEAEFQAGLAASRVTEPEFRAYMARAVLVREARARHVPAAPTDADVTAYFAEHAQKFRRPEQVQLVEIHVRVDPSGGRPAEQAARRTVATIRRRLAAGEDFGAVAWNASEDAYRVKHGEIGWVHRGRLDSALEDAVFAAPTGQLREARSLAGFHLFIVRAREPERQLTLDEARGEILKRLGKERGARALRDWKAALFAGAAVTILRDDLRDVAPFEIREDGGLPVARADSSPGH